MEGPLLRLYDLDGSVVGDRDKRHPYGRRPGRQIVAWCTAAYGEESFNLSMLVSPSIVGTSRHLLREC